MQNKQKAAPRVAVIGAGPAGLMAAEVAARGGARVTLYDRMPSAGRKLLLAGRGGLNLTHSEADAPFRSRYGAAQAALAPALDTFGPKALRDWCAGLGVATFVGSSGRVFPEGLKTSPLLRAWLRRLDAVGVVFAPRHRWLGWDGDGRPRLEAPDGPRVADADATVLALGGATWPQLGSDGAWVAQLDGAAAPLRPSNCGFVVPWTATFRERFEGHPLKNIAVEAGGRVARGDAMVTRHGLEGGPVYALSAALREAVARDGTAAFHIALRPDLDVAALTARLERRRSKDSFANGLRKAVGLAPVAAALLREGDAAAPTRDARALAALVNAVPLAVTAPMPIARAISTAGGVRFAALDAGLMLADRPGTFVAGEMLDWEAPTGGYLLQACFATGRLAGASALAWAGGERG